MNIFYLSHDVKRCAELHVDRHCVKMILEYAQLLCTAHRMIDGDLYIGRTQTGRKAKRWKHPDDTLESVLYKATHVNHPSAVWARASTDNYVWLYNLWLNLCEEYTYRYGKVHASYVKLNDILANPPKKLSSVKFTQPTPAMPDDCKRECSIESYQYYYKNHKQHLAKWTKREVPTFMI